ncbi:MAG: TlpA disulfide reductase family protein [Leptospirillia bacterium]
MPNRLRISLLASLMLLTSTPAFAGMDEALKAAYSRAGVAPSETVRTAPDFELPSLAGPMVQLSDFRGKIVVLNFWATWCRPCIKEMPSLEQLANSMQENGVAVLAVSLDAGPGSDVYDFVKGYGWDLQVLLDPLTEAGDAYAVRAMPTTYLISHEGTILGRSFGPRDWAGEESVALMEMLTRSFDSTRLSDSPDLAGPAE